MQARREWTRTWWSRARADYGLFTSEAVLDELRRGEYEKKEDCLSLLDQLPALAITSATVDVVVAYLRHKLMPSDPAGDALHLALASSTSATSC